VNAVFNWAASEDCLAGSPVKKVKRRKIARRERVLSAEEQKTILTDAGGEFRDFLNLSLRPKA